MKDYTQKETTDTMKMGALLYEYARYSKLVVEAEAAMLHLHKLRFDYPSADDFGSAQGVGYAIENITRAIAHLKAQEKALATASTRRAIELEQTAHHDATDTARPSP